MPDASLIDGGRLVGLPKFFKSDGPELVHYHLLGADTRHLHSLGSDLVTWQLLSTLLLLICEDVLEDNAVTAHDRCDEALVFTTVNVAVCILKYPSWQGIDFSDVLDQFLNRDVGVLFTAKVEVLEMEDVVSQGRVLFSLLD